MGPLMEGGSGVKGPHSTHTTQYLHSERDNEDTKCVNEME
jgi:hypothetical protein